MRCKECGYKIRGLYHKDGKQHQYGVDGHTKVLNLITGKIEEKKRRPIDANGNII